MAIELRKERQGTPLRSYKNENDWKENFHNDIRNQIKDLPGFVKSSAPELIQPRNDKDKVAVFATTVDFKAVDKEQFIFCLYYDDFEIDWGTLPK